MFDCDQIWGKKNGLILVSQYRTTPQYNLTRPRVIDDGWTTPRQSVPGLLVNTMLLTQLPPIHQPLFGPHTSFA